jgi:hypothetical protein
MPAELSKTARRAELFKTFGVAALVIGLVAASIIFWEGERGHPENPETRRGPSAQSSWRDDSLPSGDLKGTSQTIEMNFGKVAVLLSALFHWWQQLKPNQSSALLIAALAFVVATGFFLAAYHELRRKR